MHLWRKDIDSCNKNSQDFPQPFTNKQPSVLEQLHYNLIINFIYLDYLKPQKTDQLKHNRSFRREYWVREKEKIHTSSIFLMVSKFLPPSLRAMTVRRFIWWHLGILSTDLHGSGKSTTRFEDNLWSLDACKLFKKNQASIFSKI